MIVPVKKVTVASLTERKAAVVGSLHALGLVHVDAIRSEGGGGLECGLAPEGLGDVEARLARVQGLLAAVQRHAPSPPRPFIDAFIGTRELIDVGLEERESAVAGEGALVAEAEEAVRGLEARAARAREGIAERRQVLEQLRGFERLPLRLEQLTDTAHTRVFLGLSGQQDARALAEALGALGAEGGRLVHSEDLGARGADRIVLAVYHKSLGQRAGELLARHAREVRLPPAEGSPAEVAERMRAEVEGLRADEREALREFREGVAALGPRLKVLHDELAARRQALDVQRRFAHGRGVFVLTGWARECDIEAVGEAVLKAAAGAAEVGVEDPGPGDDPPVVLANAPPLAPFEVVQEMYGMPSYREVDPTPFIAPFFVVFFACCLGDAGYGLALVLAAAYLVHVKKVTGGARKLMQVLAAGGLCGVIAGALIGGAYLGDIFTNKAAYPSLYVEALTRFSLFNPMTDIMTFLYLTVAFGIVHIIYSLLIAAYKSARLGRWGDALMDQLPWLLLVPGLVAYGLVGAGALPRALLGASEACIALGALIILLFYGRNQANPVMRLGVGALGLYNLVGYLGDTLSYTRILALSLAGGVIATVVNAVAALVVATLGWAGYLVAVPVFVLGHAVNLCLSALGGFIHTARLHYVEWFGRFFDGGGRRFSPFRRQAQYVRLNQTTGATS